MTPGAKALRFLCGVAAVVMFAMPIAGIAFHAYSVDKAEREFQAWQKEQQEKTERFIRGGHVR